MAFRQPQQRPQAQRHTSYQQDPAPPPGQSQQRKRPLEESQHDWILFSPPSQTNTSQTPRTADLSRASYFGSLETGVRSDLLESDDHIVRQVTVSNANDDDGTELDSLDDGLHAFQAPPLPHLDQSGGTVLPTHDGLGAFPASYNANADALQEQLWQHERYNPQKKHIHRRLSSVQRRLDALGDTAEASEIDPQEERRLRVERWRTEQSKAVLEEIERETRRRYRRMNKSGTSTGKTRTVPPPAASIATGHESTSTGTETSESKPESDSFWQRITRKVIRDLMGLDENTLSVIFGEDLSDDLSATPTQTSPLSEAAASDAGHDNADKTWEDRLLERVARELGILVYQLSELESAFSTYTSRHPQAIPAPQRSASTPIQRPQPLPSDLDTTPISIFRPTLNRTSPISGPDASLFGIEEEPLQTTEPDASAYWEHNPSLLMIFSYLRRRFLATSPPSPPTTSPGPLPASWAATGAEPTASALGTSPESQRRADLIRRNHPLVSRATERRRESALLRRHRNELLSVLHRRQGSSSCASQSTKRSRRSSGTGQSRKYWDFPGASEGSVVTSAGGNAVQGGWGEV